MSNRGRMLSRITAQPVPKRIKGIRLPSFVSVLSEMPPKSGSRNSASTLSAAMMAPETVSLRWKVLVSIRGTMLSYSCQNAQMERNARPTRIVRLLLSFIAEISHSVFEKSRRRGVLRPAAQVFLFLNKFTLFARFIQPKI